ncbi:putative Rossmann-fold nucleotide-binding protein [Cerasibacillus quisquiliarum]|uniref:SHOCT domain-containing protein n=1 Tax=Cerasibacillus quisquiliarum TaxID=227865 RepID=A0A511UYR8_9BACI|nr:hypothetical protein [Cerasibacillus quisquiliarum]MBB5146948.1 putative Rossmann-fold nucleotide-binding protein [Cerasibacillus quisquiliarum]GEN31729.1 hypothetical protein CQU01_19670 [Cerasibacillus quisquiliarum]
MQGGELFGLLWIGVIIITILTTMIIIRKDKKRDQKVVNALNKSLAKGEISDDEYKELYLQFKDETCDACPNIKAYLKESRRRAYEGKQNMSNK